MLNTQEKDLITKFLYRNYPVRRMKLKKHFKRTIITDDGFLHYLSDKESQKALYFKLLETLKTVFYSDEDLNKEILKNFLHLK